MPMAVKPLTASLFNVLATISDAFEMPSSASISTPVDILTKRLSCALVAGCPLNGSSAGAGSPGSLAAGSSWGTSDSAPGSVSPDVSVCSSAFAWSNSSSPAGGTGSVVSASAENGSSAITIRHASKRLSALL